MLDCSAKCDPLLQPLTGRCVLARELRGVPEADSHTHLFWRSFVRVGQHHALAQYTSGFARITELVAFGAREFCHVQRGNGVTGEFMGSPEARRDACNEPALPTPFGNGEGLLQRFNGQGMTSGCKGPPIKQLLRLALLLAGACASKHR